ncbi:MAG: hypothetical protein INR66_24905, partial [Gordonia polyisoprenivorans]|nr:hypothetical protein [Gordonia polyisoprenivorans]
FTGRIMHRRKSGVPGRETVRYEGVCNKYWLSREYAWVNNLFPPEFQVGLTGKQDVEFGPPDPVMKNYVTKVNTRLNRPVYSALPIKWPGAWTQPNLADIDSLDDLIGTIQDAAAEIVGLQARFTQLDDLFRNTVERLERGVTLDLWDGTGQSPMVFSTDTLGKLQSILDHTSDHFLDLGQLAQVSQGLWSNQANRACYIFDTHDKRDNRKVHFRTDGRAQISEYDYSESHADAVRSIVGGRAPAILNDLIEIGANFAIQLLINLIAPGLGLGVVVGDLFDDIFFAFQVFSDFELEDDIGEDGAFPEVFADNTAAWSVDGYATGKTALHDHGGSEALVISPISGIGDKGNSFGADLVGSARRYQLGDVVRFTDRGTTVDQYVSKVKISDTPGDRCRELPTVGKSKQLQGPWTRAITGFQGFAATTRGIANST